MNSLPLSHWIRCGTTPRNATARQVYLWRSLIPRLLLGTICGLIYGALSAVSMLPLEFADKTAALTGAFLNRFTLGFVIGAARLPVPAWVNGLIFGILLSFADAILRRLMSRFSFLAQSEDSSSASFVLRTLKSTAQCQFRQHVRCNGQLCYNRTSRPRVSSRYYDLIDEGVLKVVRNSSNLFSKES